MINFEIYVIVVSFLLDTFFMFIKLQLHVNIFNNATFNFHFSMFEL